MNIQKKNKTVFKAIIAVFIVAVFIIPSSAFDIESKEYNNIENKVKRIDFDLQVYLGSCYWSVMNEELIFIASAVGGSGNYQFKWDFGDGANTDWLDENGVDCYMITHIYNLPAEVDYKEYWVNVSVKDTESNNKSYCEEPVEIIRYELWATITGQEQEQTGYEYEVTLQFDGSKGPYDYSIDWGDGSVLVNVYDVWQWQDIAHIYNNPGVYTITAYVEDDLNCHQQVVATYEVEIIPSEIGSVYLDVPFCYQLEGEEIIFTASAVGGSGIYSFKWDFGDGSSTDWIDSNSVEHVYTLPQLENNLQYTVTVYVKNRYEEPPLNPQSDSASILIIKEALWGTLDGPGSAEINTYLEFQIDFGGGIAPYKYHVNWGDNTEDIHSNWINQAQTVTLSHIYSERAIYTITLVIEDTISCSENEIITKQIEIYDESIINIRTGQPYGTIQAAVDDAINGDTITVASGVYSGPYYQEYINIDKRIDLIGECPENTIIDGRNIGTVINIEDTNNVKITGFTIKNASGEYSAGIRICSESSNNIFQNNIIKNCSHGLLIWGDNNDIFDNTIISNGAGLKIETSDENNIYSNVIKNNGRGIGFYSTYYGSSNNNIFKNTIEGNSIGISSGWSNSGGHSNRFYNNNFLFGSGSSPQEHFNNNDPDDVLLDNGYLNGGNYWEEYSDLDLFSGENQDQIGSDGIIDSPYNLPIQNLYDNYPLVHPYGSIKNIDTQEIFFTIRKAITDSDTNHGNTILVKDGVYTESNIYDGSLNINKAITLQGNDKTTTIIDGCLYDGDVIKITSNDVTITGFTIQNSGYRNPLNDGIYLHGSTGVTINNNILRQNGQGIMVKECGGNLIENNILEDNGLSLSFANNNIIQSNFLEGQGIELYSAFENEILNNYATNSDNAISIIGSFSTNCYENTISENTLQYNNKGIYLYKINWGGGNIFSQNTIKNNDYGIYSRLSEDNKFYYNDFIQNNIYNAYEEESDNIWDDQVDTGNYWDDFETNPGYPNYYEIAGGDNHDNYPSTQPFSSRLCGDANGDDNINVSDAVFIINYVFIGGPAPDTLCVGDANGDGGVNVSDAVWIINYIFVGGPPPVEDCCD